MKRREILFGLGAGALAWPMAARAQQERPVVGFLGDSTAEAMDFRLAGFRRGLAETSFVEGETVRIDYGWGEGHYERLPALATGLVGRGVSVLVTGGGTLPALAAKRATATVPVVFVTGSDPVKDGLVTSFSRPDGNITGVALLTAVIAAKQLELLRALIPDATSLAVLVNPADAQNFELILQTIREAAAQVPQKIHVLNAATAAEIDAAFAELPRLGARALLVTAEPFYQTQLDQIVVLAAQGAVPTLHIERSFAVAGGLMSYGPSIGDMYRQAGVYAGRILKGAKPTDLPVVQPTKFDLVINLKTAQSFGLTIPPTLLALADEVIE